MKRKLTDKQLAALRKNAVKARKALALKLKRGEPVGKGKTQEIPLSLIPLEAQPVTPAKRKFAKKERVAGRESVDALAQLIVATWAEVQRRKGTL